MKDTLQYHRPETDSLKTCQQQVICQSSGDAGSLIVVEWDQDTND